MSVLIKNLADTDMSYSFAKELICSKSQIVSLVVLNPRFKLQDSSF